MNRIEKQLAFIIEIDKLKSVFRRNYVSDGSRKENDAEHSWYFALSAMILAEHANESIDINRVMRMGLIHDIVEIDAGDTFIYDDGARLDQEARERMAAERLFGMLPDDQRDEFRALWDEFEAHVTAESRFARAIDRVSAVILNHATGGKAWREHGVTYHKVYDVNRKIADGSTSIWHFIEGIINDAANRGILPR